jgi:hypothetical protein
LFSEDKLLNDLAKWLSAPDPFINYNTASDARYDGTSLWFTNGSEYKDWKESSSLLWIQGKRAFSITMLSLLSTKTACSQRVLVKVLSRTSS